MEKKYAALKCSCTFFCSCFRCVTVWCSAVGNGRLHCIAERDVMLEIRLNEDLRPSPSTSLSHKNEKSSQTHPLSDWSATSLFTTVRQLALTLSP